MFKTLIKAINRLIERLKIARAVRTTLKLIGSPRVHSIIKYAKPKPGIHLCVLLRGENLPFRDRLLIISKIKHGSGVDSVIIYGIKNFEFCGRYKQISKTSVLIYPKHNN